MVVGPNSRKIAGRAYRSWQIVQRSGHSALQILVTGKHGQLARCLADRAVVYSDVRLRFAAREGAEFYLDMADEASIRSAVKRISPDIIINAAAYTAVDKAEDEPDLAHQINGTAPGTLAQEAELLGIPILHVSTDYVFSGDLDRPYLPEDQVNPQSVYGASKLLGEENVRAATDRHAIVRTAWVHSPYGTNFPKTMLRLAETRDEISVVDDQIGNPTEAHDIADALLQLAQVTTGKPAVGLGETFHFAGPESMSWCDFAKRVLADVTGPSGKPMVVNPITTADYPTKAKRPANSRLDRTKFDDLKKLQTRSRTEREKPLAGYHYGTRASGN
ncbi:MAG: dTDP-4-dehydrorhamnose reductase [Pseudomonadota bacterium]